ncbi:MAG: NmrA family NAD(P)-binding protein [Myxococcota bacterium]
MTILVIGATGTVGSEVARQLAAVGAEFVCGLRNPSSIKADYPTVELDFARPETFEHAVQGVTRVFLVAPAFMDDAAEVIGPLIDKAVAAGATHVVYSSVMGAELNPQGSHRKLELAIEGSGAHFTHVRPNFFMQNFLTYEQDNLAKGIIYLPTGEQTWS